MQYELDNPSDAYTFKANSREVAALTVFLLGTQYGATPESGNDDDRVPIFIFGGAGEWYEETFGRTADEGIAAHEADVAAALSSFMLGHFEDRRRYDAALEAITDDEKRREFIEKWQDARTSMNNIGSRAHQLAEAIGAKLAKVHEGEF